MWDHSASIYLKTILKTVKNIFIKHFNSFLKQVLGKKIKIDGLRGNVGHNEISTRKYGDFFHARIPSIKKILALLLRGKQSTYQNHHRLV